MIRTVLLLAVANVFMTTAWYGHLRYTSFPLWKVVLASWSIALIEYCFQVPANRFGYAHYSAAQLKTTQEILTSSRGFRLSTSRKPYVGTTSWPFC